jgi:hypothetical protein
MSGQTHWKKLHNPDYLGAYSLEPGKDMILTISKVVNEMVTGPDNRKEECIVVHFVEKQKPMIINATNAKTIQKLYKTPYIEEWAGKKIQVFADKVKAFGEVVESLRIRPTAPRETKIDTKCADCKGDIQAFGQMSSEQMALYTTKKYNRPLCSECATKINTEKAVETNVDQ